MFSHGEPRRFNKQVQTPSHFPIPASSALRGLAAVSAIREPGQVMAGPTYSDKQAFVSTDNLQSPAQLTCAGN